LRQKEEQKKAMAKAAKEAAEVRAAEVCRACKTKKAQDLQDTPKHLDILAEVAEHIQGDGGTDDNEYNNKLDDGSDDKDYDLDDEDGDFDKEDEVVNEPKPGKIQGWQPSCYKPNKKSQLG
jgi:hypothetical protein